MAASSKGKISTVGRDRKYCASHIDGTGDDCTTGPVVGPGTYTALRNKSGAFDTFEHESTSAIDRGRKYKIEGKANKLAFNATGTQRELPFEARHASASNTMAGMPEPGKYDPRVTEKGDGLSANARAQETFNANSKKGTASFGVNAPARLAHETTRTAPSMWQTNGTLTDPGAYDPNLNREIAHDVKSSFQKGAQAGRAGFGGHSKRELKLEVTATTSQPKAGMLVVSEETPAASQYTPQLTETGREHDMYALNGTEKMKSASFATKSQRPSPVLPQASVPGPGSYESNFETMAASSKGKISTVGRDRKYCASHIDGTGDDCTTGPVVGPGTYTALRNKSGDCDTILQKADVEVMTGVGTNAVFTSTLLRSPTRSPNSVMMAW